MPREPKVQQGVWYVFWTIGRSGFFSR
jgi:hypothetical protein